MRRRTALGLLLGAGVGVTAARAADPAATAPIQALVQALTRAMQAGRATPFPRRFEMIAPAVDGAFDLPAVLAASVGLRLNSAPADQKAALLEQFRRFTIASYAANFDNPADRLEVLGTQRELGADIVVPTRVVPASGDPTSIDYLMRHTPQGWRAVDVLLDGGISQNAVKRSDFRALVAGGSLQPLIDSLRTKVRDLSGNTMS